MKSRRIKWVNPLFIIFLALAGVFGVSSAYLSQVKEEPVVEKALAEGWTSHVVYYSTSTSRANYFVRCNRGGNTGGNQYENFWLTDTGYKYGGNYVYSTTVWDYWGGVDGMWIKYGDGTDGGSTNLSTPISSFTSSSTYDGKLWNGTAWKTVYTVVFNMQSHGTAPTSLYVDSGSKVTKPTDPTASGYRFDGWYKEAACTNAWNFSTDTVTSNKTLYAKWVARYSITYYNNDGSGRTYTDYVDAGSSYTVKHFEDIAGFVSQGYNAFIKWTKNSDGSGGNYNPDQKLTINANLTLYFNQSTATYEYSRDGGSTWNALSHNGTGPEGYVAEYFAGSQTFTSGDMITIRKYYNSTSNYIEQRAVTAGQRNYDMTTGIKYSTVNSIYVQVNDTGGTTVLVDGYAARGISIERDGHSYKVAGTEVSSTDWSFTNIVVFPGDVIKGVYEGGTPYTVSGVTADSTFGISSSGAISYPGVFTIHLTGLNEIDVDWLNFTMDNNATAELLAQMFNNDFTTICSSIEGGGSTSQLSTPFGITHAGYYNHITSAAQTALKSGSSDDDVVAMRAKYDRIVGKYKGKVDGVTDYMGRNPAAISGMAFPAFTLFGAEEDMSTIIVIVASSVALLSITALGILVIKKRKREQE